MKSITRASHPTLHGRAGRALALKLALEVSSGMDFLHSQGVVHRLVKLHSDPCEIPVHHTLTVRLFSKGRLGRCTGL